MKISNVIKLVLIIPAAVMLMGLGLGDLNKAVPKVGGSGEDCSKSADPKKCEKNKAIKSGAQAVAVGVAAKVIYDMVIEFSTAQTSPEDKVVADYKKKNKDLPAEAQVLEYASSLKPGEVVNAGKEVKVVSSLVVVPGKDGKAVEIKEQINIHDNEDNKKVLKSLSKMVNEGTKKTGAYHNEFKFTLPVGMPQGVYPVKTVVMLNGKEAKPSNNKMQLVLHVDDRQHYQIVAIRQ